MVYKFYEDETEFSDLYKALKLGEDNSYLNDLNSLRPASGMLPDYAEVQPAFGKKLPFPENSSVVIPIALPGLSATDDEEVPKSNFLQAEKPGYETDVFDKRDQRNIDGAMIALFKKNYGYTPSSGELIQYTNLVSASGPREFFVSSRDSDRCISASSYPDQANNAERTSKVRGLLQNAPGKDDNSAFPIQTQSEIGIPFVKGGSFSVNINRNPRKGIEHLSVPINSQNLLQQGSNPENGFLQFLESQLNSQKEFFPIRAEFPDEMASQKQKKQAQGVGDIIRNANALAYASEGKVIDGLALKNLIAEINIAKTDPRTSNIYRNHLASAWRSLYTRGQTEGILDATSLPDQLIQDGLGAPGGSAARFSVPRTSSILPATQSRFIPFVQKKIDAQNTMPLRAFYRGKEIDSQAAIINPELVENFFGPIDPHKIYRRTVSPSQPLSDLDLIVNSGELWGNPNYSNKLVPSISALRGPLPKKDKGLEFVTAIPTDNVDPKLNGQVNWRRNVHNELYPGMKSFENKKTGDEALSMPITVIHVDKGM